MFKAEEKKEDKQGISFRQMRQTPQNEVVVIMIIRDNVILRLILCF